MNSASITVGKIKTAKRVKSKFKFDKVFITKVSTVIILIGLIVLSGLKIRQDSNGKIFPNVMVAGIKVGGKTPAQAKNILLNYTNLLSQKGPSINYEDQTINSTLPELGVSFNVDEIVNEAYNFGRSGSVKDKIVQNSQIIFTHRNLALEPKVDENKLDEFLSKLNQTVTKPAQNATLQIENGQIKEITEKQGFGFDKDILKENLFHAINNKVDEKITIAITTLEPKIVVSDTTSARSQAEILMSSSPINLIYQDRAYSISKNDIGSWIDFKDNNSQLTAEINDSKVATYASSITSKIAVKKIDKEIMDGTGEVLVEGQDGIGVDTATLTKKIVAQVKANNKTNIAIGTYPIPKQVVTKNPHAQPGRYPGKYIDINLTEQTLYAFEGTNLVKQFLISSGVAGHNTPTGEYHVYAKTRAQTMDGPGYSLPNVEWISWWSGDYSIHGTYWHSNFGHTMSHGCVNASNGDAEWIYNWDEVGTPVYVHL